jgi:phosphoribosylanthranilate isomerase
MSLFVKVCGVKSLESAYACAEAGADAIGFVFAESPRRISPARAWSISESLPRALLRVAVFRRPSARELERVLDDFQPDLIQADHHALGAVAEARRLPVYREGADQAPSGGRFLYEGPTSGVGEQVDWGRAAEMARLGEMILAGGLRPDNVGRAIASVRPFGVDVSSGVETEPGVKAPALIRSFVAAARAAEERLVSNDR